VSNVEPAAVDGVWEHPTGRLIAGALCATLIVAALRITHVVPPIFLSNATITQPQIKVISLFAARHEGLGHRRHAGCAVDVLGARKEPHGVVAYTVVHCWAGDGRCHNDENFTDGVVAHLDGTDLTAAEVDDAIESEGSLAVAKRIYPDALTQRAFDLMDSDGPRSYDAKARALAGC